MAATAVEDDGGEAMARLEGGGEAGERTDWGGAVPDPAAGGAWRGSGAGDS